MKNIICILVMILLVSCQKKSNKKFEKLEKMNWLLGHWEQKLPDGKLLENWLIKNDSTLIGQSFFVNSKDTVHFENIILTQKANQLIYIATVEGQNNDEPVNFKQTADTNNIFIFENPKHDYPQKIIYKKVNESNLITIISGKQDNKKCQESYSMKKI